MYKINLGYIGYSMSVRAANAYANGEIPWSKWTKKDILKELKGMGIDYEKLQKYPNEILKNFFLYKTSWHHTSKMFNKTDFYDFDEDAALKFLESPEEILEIFDGELETRKKDLENLKKAEPNPLRIVQVRYGEWEGTRRHPKLVFRDDFGVRYGKWVYLVSNDKKKNLEGSHIEVLKEFNKAPNGYAKQINEIKTKISKRK